MKEEEVRYPLLGTLVCLGSLGFLLAEGENGSVEIKFLKGFGRGDKEFVVAPSRQTYEYQSNEKIVENIHSCKAKSVNFKLCKIICISMEFSLAQSL